MTSVKLHFHAATCELDDLAGNLKFTAKGHGSIELSNKPFRILQVLAIKSVGIARLDDRLITGDFAEINYPRVYKAISLRARIL